MDLYLGREVEPTPGSEGSGWTDRAPLHFAGDRLTRHGVCLGMTGSGKTGLCVAMLEELARAGVPVIALDPKGDLANLALRFPRLDAESFAPWVAPSRTGSAHEVARSWRDGLAGWGLGPAEVADHVERVAVRVFTPGSTAGLPIDILGALRCPSPAARTDEEGTRELVQGTVSSLLGLLGIEADPLRDPRHVVLSRILDEGWRREADGGPPTDLETLIVHLVDPPFGKVGVFPLDTFYPRAARMELALQLNALVASPGFRVWSEGTPLDIDALFGPDAAGRTPIHVFTLAHLDEPQRHFFVALLLHRVVAWARRQPGSAGLRALLFFDEILGYLPPHPRNPATREPLLRILKQARGVGLGALLCTQNPVDLDYKALSNAGTWIVGRLSTRQDRDRVLDGLAGAAAIDRASLAATIDGLPDRTFVLRDVAEPGPTFLRSRWTMSYLRGPLTRAEVARLEQGPPHPQAVVRRGPAPAPTGSDPGDGYAPTPPPAPTGYAYRFLDPAVAFGARLAPLFAGAVGPPRADGRTVWRPALYARLHIRFDEGAEFLVERTEHRLFFPLEPERVPCGEPELGPEDLRDDPPPGLYAPLPEDADHDKELARIGKLVVEDVFRGETEVMFRARELGLSSRGGEDRATFAARAAAVADERADADVARLEAKVAREVDRLEAKRRDLERDLEGLRVAARGRAAAEVMHAGEILYAFFFSGRARSLHTAVSKRNQTSSANQRVGRAESDLAELGREVYDLEDRTRTEILAVRNAWARRAEAVEEMPVRLEREDVRLDELVVVWVPVTRPGMPSEGVR